MRRPGDLVLKDPHSEEPYGIDWTAWLAEIGVGVAILTSAWAVDEGDVVLVLSSPTIITGNLKTQIHVSGGTLGVQYRIRNRITTTSTPAVVDDRSFEVLVQNR